MPVSKNHNKKECHSKKRKRYARYKFDQQRKWKRIKEAEMVEQRIQVRSKLEKIREQLFGNKKKEEDSQ